MHRTTHTTATLLALLASACAAQEGRDGTGFGSGNPDTSAGSEDAPTSTIETASGESTSPAISSADTSTSHEGTTSGIGTSTSASGSTSNESGTTGDACDDPPGTPVGPNYSLGLKFQDHYAIYDLGEVPGIDACLGGALIKPTDPNNLLIIGNPGIPSAQLFKIGLTRGLCGHITGFQGSATVVADVPQAQSLLLAREDLLLITVTPSNRLYQLLNGANTPSWTYDFDVMKEVQYSASGIGIVPDSYGLPARTICFSSWTLGAFTCGSIKTDGPLAELSGLTQLSTYSDADFGFAYVPESLDLPVLPTRSLLGNTISGVSAYRCDDDGVPIYDTKEHFVNGDSLNVHIDPVQGDVLISALEAFPKLGEDPFCHLLVVRPRKLIAN